MKFNFFKIIGNNFHTHVATEREQEITRDLRRNAQKSVDQVLGDMNTANGGLTDREAAERLGKYGPNAIAHDRAKPGYIQLFSAFNNPFNYVLLLLAVVSIFTGGIDSAIIITVMILISVSIRFTQEYRSGKSAEALRAMVHTTTAVTRAGEGGVSATKEVPIAELVPGDIIQLAAGDIIPADVRILHSKTLYISQSALTGEAMPVEKDDTDDGGDNILEIKNLCFMGTNVDTGSATAVVLATGGMTYFGAMAQSLQGKRELTGFDIGVNKVSWFLIRLMAIMVPVVFLIVGVSKGDWLDALVFALAVGVGLTPEMLPVVVTTNLAKGAVNMSRDKVIVKHLNAIQNLGSMDILCTDKTGTLTEDHVVLLKHLDIFGNDSEKVLRYAYLNSYFQSGMKNQMDMAILENKDIQKEEEEKTVASWHKIDELPFDFVRRRMSVILRNGEGVKMICKGALEEMISCSKFVDAPQGELPMTDELRGQILKNATDINKDGLRVVAVGHKSFPATHPDTYTVDEECPLVLDGFVAFLDPPKESAREALKALADNGINVKVLTGDNDIVTANVCRAVGLDFERVVLGAELDALSDGEATELAEKFNIFAKLTPMQKSRIVKLLRLNGHDVGYLGDGINDAVSLREADIGISVDTAVDIARESADLILLQKSLMVLNDGVVEGRRTYGNTIKYIKATTSSNFGNVFSILAASTLFPFLPMLPLQILILNLLYDISQTFIPWDNVDREFLTKPHKWATADIKRFTLTMGPVSSVFDFATFAVLYFVFMGNSIENQAIFQTGWFMESLFTQTLVVMIIRTEKIPFLQSWPSRVMMTASGILLAIGLILPFTILGHIIGFTTMPAGFYLWLTAIILSYCTMMQLIKIRYIRRHKIWL